MLALPRSTQFQINTWIAKKRRNKVNLNQDQASPMPPPRVPQECSKLGLITPFPPSASTGCGEGAQASERPGRARRRCESQPAGGPGPAAWLLLLQRGNLTPASQALRCEWAGKEPFLRLFAPQVPATWLAWWDRRPGRYHAELPRSARHPLPPSPPPAPAPPRLQGGQRRSSARQALSSFLLQS